MTLAEIRHTDRFIAEQGLVTAAFICFVDTGSRVGENGKISGEARGRTRI